MLTLFPSGLGDLGCWHIPEAWVPRWTVVGRQSWERCAGQWALPHRPACLLPSAPAHNLQIQGVLLHPKDVEPLGWKSYEKPPGLHVSQCWGSHLQPPSLGLPHLWWKHPPESGVAGTGMCSGDGGEEGRRNGRQALGVSSSTFHSDSPGTGLSLRLWFPQNMVEHKDMLPPCGHFP